MEFRVEGNLRWEGVVPDACARGKVGSGWWVGVNVYYEVEKWADILRTAHLYHTWTGIIGLEACRKPGCPSGVSHFRRREMAQQSLDDAGSRPSPFFSKLYTVRDNLHTSGIPENAQATPTSM